MQVGRGFHRLGMVGLVPLVGVGLVLWAHVKLVEFTAPAPVTVVIGPDNTRHQWAGELQWHEIEAKLTKMHGAPIKVALTDFRHHFTGPWHQAREERSLAVVLVAFGAIWYGICWALGWVIAGFMGDSRKDAEP